MMRRRVSTILTLLMAIVAILAPMSASGQTSPDPKPETVPFFYDASGLFPEDQQVTLQRDAQLLQSSEIPTLVYVRQTTSDEAEVESSLAFAEQLRREWGIESSRGADDGLVLLVSWVPEDHRKSSVVQASGTATFDDSGLSAESIQRTIDTSVASLIDQDKPFETLVYLMRETRYTGIYSPPPPKAIEGAAKTVHDTLTWAGPAISGAVIIILVMLSMQFWRARPTDGQIWGIAGGVLCGAALLWGLSVYAQSRAGILASLLMVGFLAVAAWLWGHTSYTERHHTGVQRRVVPDTRRRMRRRSQMRKMAHQTGGGR
jgi:uncharacterized membrane protein YgcG